MRKSTKVKAVLLSLGVLVLPVLTGCASCQRAWTDLKSDVSGGMQRIIKVYTADGELLAEYEGKIDLDANDGGYIKFDFNGKRYMYYNCFVESIADIH